MTAGYQFGWNSQCFAASPSPVSPPLSHRSVTPHPPDDELPNDNFPSPPVNETPKEKKIYHPYLTGEKCNQDSEPLPANTPPLAQPSVENVWASFNGEVQFCLADFLFCKVEMSQGDVNDLMDLWALDLHKYKDEGQAPFSNHQALHKAIDEIWIGSVPWKCFKTVVPENLDQHAPEWQKRSYQIWFHDLDVVISNILANREFDTTPYVHLDPAGKRHWSDFMSGNYAWRHATQIFEANPETKGAMYVSVILGSDKTTVSVAIGNVEYYPVYLSIGNLCNPAWHGHCNGVVPITFIAIPKSDQKYDRDVAFHLFKKKLYHQSLTAVLSSLLPTMTEPVICQCPDGYYRRVIYDLGPYIADYPEQVLLAGIVQGWCPKCTAPASNLDAPGDRRSRKHTEVLLESLADDGDILWDNYGIDKDILIIKGSFKDHLVEWVYNYLVIKEGEARAKEIMDHHQKLTS
ncbi:uncharacterized protein ARMOST_14258 [Armillaria ostoyae]|uniref:Uncharacterized protein n=1 Tax=Armillaria ostoyae TaxID=47428 RepID=A0A284RQ43_ARMOS|nr:uncharacterized protein ARMOST_14258 [Armillaria ostoyae]